MGGCLGASAAAAIGPFGWCIRSQSREHSTHIICVCVARWLQVSTEMHERGWALTCDLPTATQDPQVRHRVHCGAASFVAVVIGGSG